MAFEALQRLVLQVERSGRGAVADLQRALITLRLQHRFSELVLEATNHDVSAAGFAMTSLSRTAPHAVVEVVLPQLSARSARGELVIRAGAIAAHVFGFLRALDVPGVSLVVHQSGGSLPGESELDALKDDLRRLRPVRATFPSEWGVADL